MMIRGDARHLPIATNTIDCVVTSPPYLSQRMYGLDDREIGRDLTLATYLATIGDVFDECRRVMRPGAWLNIGDKANTSGGAGGDWSKATRKARRDGPQPEDRTPPTFSSPTRRTAVSGGRANCAATPETRHRLASPTTTGPRPATRRSRCGGPIALRSCSAT